MTQTNQVDEVVECEASLTRAMAIVTLEAAVAAAKAGWTGLDWETDLTCGNCDDDYAGDPEGLEAAKAAERKDVEDDASGASSLGDEALGFAREGNWRGCVMALEEAKRLESGYGDAPAWGRALEVARRLAVDEVHCQCGEWSGEPCEWHGPRSETVVVEYMPEHIRAHHVHAENRGVYPHNGAIRIRVEASCAEHMIETDGEWVALA